MNNRLSGTKPQGLSAASPCIPADVRVPGPSPIGFRFLEGPGSQHRLRYADQLLNRRNLRPVYRIAVQFQHSTQHSRIIIRRMQRGPLIIRYRAGARRRKSELAWVDLNEIAASVPLHCLEEFMCAIVPLFGSHFQTKLV